MKLILTAPVAHLGVPGEVVEVRDGYGRNYLLPKGHAIAWTRGAEKQIEGIKRARDAREIRGLDHAKQVREQLEALEVVLPARAGANGKLFGAVTSSDLVAAIRTANGPAVDKRSIVVEKPIRNVGNHTVGIKLHDAVTAHIKVNVTAA
ncbi:50S ribosomal protein L9 [Propioniciclava tarda]|uniref:Large ribosomal subunit protein bL9 n=1 Tax=Propioniciclava tarda TaxID=433330 RepID=A0A4Q9KP16_PROTD|nr:50S ribosomal protein L9 [Propioniciclava tarda]TBT96234.1 50S ribosomal protein L9 [Propioniciclava tarda]SMO33992.1 LSU ribosomal protein L9P [Propioniciclava tarda]HOA89131.1 50S ribosomal protein L9 [Propioniciclava tarda]HQA30118.1 50S ribosomal protein L9 [Propioniciclava tarda]HQD60011.1 50S ribosomal protein L9 [Propioniciclava tarda]